MKEQKSISLFNYYKQFTSEQIIKISNFLEKPELNLDLEQYYINLDVRYDVLLTNSQILVNQLFYKLYFYHKNYFVFTKHSFYRLDQIPNLSNFIHTNPEIIKNYLYLEQLIELLKETSTVVEYPDVLDFEIIYENNHVPKLQLDKLNSEQLLAVKQIKGPSILLAPAGSGKTKTLVNRIVYLIQKGVNPKNILVLAFNKKAQLELSNRLEQNFKLKTNIKTFHAFGNQIIKDVLGYDFDKNNSILKNIINNDYEKYEQTISRIKNDLLTKNDIKDNLAWQLFEQYFKIANEEKIYNFDDMLYLAIKILLDNQLLRQELQQKYEYIMIDEFQDLNKAQLTLVDIISKPQNNIFVVGDDDQMIYRFRGASEMGILNYSKIYSVCNKNILETNYRSPKNIVNHANQLIDYNKNRVNKNIKSFKKYDGKLDLIIEDDMYKETLEIVKYIKKMKTINNNYNDFAILYRYNQYADLIRVCLEINNLPVKNQESEILKTPLGKIIFNYLQLVIETKPSKQVIQNCLYNFDNTLPYLFITQINSLEDLFNIENLNSNLTTEQITTIQNFIRKLKTIKLNIDINLDTLINFFNIDKIDYLKELNNDENTSLNETFNIIAQIGNILGNIANVYRYFITKKPANENGIILSTIHKTKGNEFPNVIYYHVISTPNLLIEDERRLFYVAVTRAKENLLITTNSKEQSIFVKEYFLNKNLKQFKTMDLKLDLIRAENNISVLERNLDKLLEKIDEILFSKKSLDEDDLIVEYYHHEQSKLNLEKRIDMIKQEIYYRKKLIN